MLQNLRPIEIVLLVALVVLLFGAKKLPELAKGVGQSLKIFKKEIRSVRDSDDDQPSAATDSAEQTTTADDGAEPLATSAEGGSARTAVREAQE